MLAVALVCAGCGDARTRPLPEAPLAVTRTSIILREGSTDLPVEGALEDQGAVPVSPTEVAILDHDLGRIVVLDTAGRVVRSFGRRGGGPGEIQDPRFLVRTRAGIGVLDDQKYALVMFAPDGKVLSEIPWNTVLGAPTGIVTGLMELDDGSWVFSTTEKSATTSREALYRRVGGTTTEIAATLPVPSRPVRLPCGITLSPAPPVLTPTLRWSAAGMRVAYATTAEDRVIIRDERSSDSTVVTGTAAPIAATESAALASLPRLQASIGNRGCVLTPEEALAQRGMASSIPLIDRLTLAPGGELWVQLRVANGPPSLRVHLGAAGGIVSNAIFPALFLTEDRFMGEEKDSTGMATISAWESKPGH